MATTFINRLRSNFLQKDILGKIIVLNVILYILFLIYKTSFHWFKIDVFNLYDFIAIPTRFTYFIYRPWTILTYMFFHQDFFHILYNMLFLYWFGKLFLNYFTSKNLGSLYVFGGIAGGVLFLLAYNFLPLYKDAFPTVIIGSSASVMAIIFAAAFYNPSYKLNLLFLGSVKVVYIALLIFVLDLASIGNILNSGGHFAHIGGAAMGYFFAYQYKKGRDITAWLTSIINFFVNLFKPKKLYIKKNKKPSGRKFETDYEYNARKKATEYNIDNILDKIKSSGYSSLSSDEKKQLFDASKK